MPLNIFENSGSLFQTIKLTVWLHYNIDVLIKTVILKLHPDVPQIFVLILHFCLVNWVNRYHVFTFECSKLVIWNWLIFEGPIKFSMDNSWACDFNFYFFLCIWAFTCFTWGWARPLLYHWVRMLELLPSWCISWRTVYILICLTKGAIRIIGNKRTAATTSFTIIVFVIEALSSAAA